MLLQARQTSVNEFALGVDIGRTKIAMGVVEPSGYVLDRIVEPAPAANDQLAVTAAVERMTLDFLRKYLKLRAVGIGTPEVVQWPEGVTLPSDPSGEDFHSARGLAPR